MVGANISGDNQRPVHLQPSQLWMIPIVAVVEKGSASVASKLPGDQQGNARSNKLVQRDYWTACRLQLLEANIGRPWTRGHYLSSRCQLSMGRRHSKHRDASCRFFRMSQLHADSSSSKPTLADPGQEGITYLHAASSR